MKRLLSFLLVLVCVAPLSAVKVGQSWVEVESELGKPINRLDAPGRSIGRWQDLEVIFVDGRVESFLRRNLMSEAASEARRKAETQKLRQMREELEAEKRQREEANEMEGASQLDRERKAQIAKIAALEAQLEAERKRLKFLNEKTEEQSRDEAVSHSELLAKEIPLLGQEIQRALSMGEIEKASRLQRDLIVKQNELKALEKARR